jgi:hypothetical protein
MRGPIFGRSVYNSERSAGENGRAREELKTVRLGAATRERFLQGGGEKRFGVAAGPCGFGSTRAAAAACADFRQFLFARRLDRARAGDDNKAFTGFP